MWWSYLYNGEPHTWKDGLSVWSRPRFRTGAQKQRGCQGDCPGHHWGHWSLLSTSPGTSNTVILTIFPFQCTGKVKVGNNCGHYSNLSSREPPGSIVNAQVQYILIVMMTPPNGNIFCVTGPLCGEFTGHRWIPLKRPVTLIFDVLFDLHLEQTVE